jgi:hypothetical protein
MHPIILNEIAKDRIADWHRQAERDGMARAAKLARKKHARNLKPSHQAMALARRALAALGARSLRPSPAQPEQAPKATKAEPGPACAGSSAVRSCHPEEAEEMPRV